ncbi:MAG: glycosyltransferase [bacterium]
MKILQINKFFFLKGGAERHLFDLLELLAEKGHEVLVWSANHPKNFSFYDKNDFAEFNDLSKKQGIIKEIKKAKRIFWNKEAKDKLEKLLIKTKPDIAHLHNIFSHLSPSIIFALKKHNIPIVMTLHDYKLFCPNYQFFSQDKICFDCIEKKNYKSCLSKKCIKNSFFQSMAGYLEGKWQKDFLKIVDKIDMFLAPSLFMKKKALMWGIPSEKIVHLPNFINKEPQTNTYGENKYFLYFGRLSSEKGVKFLIKAFLKISIQLPDWKLTIVGDGPEKEKLEELVGHNKQIEFLGHKNGKELKEIAKGAYLIITPSVWPENFPYSILEGLVLGKMVIGAKIGGIPELIKHKKTGLLFKPNNQNDLIEKIFWAVENSIEVSKIAEAGQNQVLSKYSPEKYYNKIIKTYNEILKK